MTLMVVDASVLTAFYTGNDVRRQMVVRRLRTGDAIFAPAHLDAEVLSALRRIARVDPAVDQAVPSALIHLANSPIRRLALAPLLPRMWELRANVTPYDAAYVALAERLGGAVLTCDARLASASGPRCSFDLISGP